MRILTINYEYPPVGGGGGVMAAMLSARLVQMGHRVDYVTTHFSGFAREETINGVRIFREPVPARRDLHTASISSMLAFPFVCWRRVAALSRNNRYDLIHTHFAIPSGPGGWISSKRLRIPNVLSVYGGDIYDPSKPYSPHRHPVLKRVVKSVLSQAAVIVGESVDICDRTRQIYNPATQVRRIPLGFGPFVYTPVSREALGLRDDRLYAIAVSRLIPRKRYADLLHAFAQANVAGMDLVIVGDGPEEPAMRELVQQLKLNDRVIFAGPVGEEQKYQLLANCDVFVIASEHEGFGMMFLEAMHCGLPIVTTNSGGQVDFLIEGRNGLLSAPRDINALSASIRKVASDPDMRQKMRKQNQHDVSAYYISNVADQYVQLFSEVMENSTKQAGA